ncbi:unnamed protein product [Cylindrotheca closterium]|uniref:Uncharacterized protein n=1 Tax=Cylindrotheca closterium TaxID=2856 RepID=A0AAD2JIG1_9STRA|nr:unnamed protein product [Cylindrotheca closterium]
MRISVAELWMVGIILGLFLLAMLFLACSMNPRELLDCSLFRCCWRNSTTTGGGRYSYRYSRATRRRGVNPRSSDNHHHDEDDEGGVDITFPTIDEYIFDSQSGEAGFVAMEEGDDDDDDERAAAGMGTRRQRQQQQQQRPITMNHVFPDLLADNGEE